MTAPTNRRTVVLVGCGNIGFRHLQALTAMAVPADIVVVEPATAAHPRIHQHLADSATGPHSFRVVADLAEHSGPADLAVVATTAEHRRAVLDQLLDQHPVGTLILEKILFPSVADLDHAAAALGHHAIPTFVNCGRRTFAGYHELAQQAGGSPVTVTVHGQRLGLASNLVHFLDLAEFLNRSALSAVDLAGLQPGAVPGKRPGFVELFGTVTATLDNGARLTVTSADVDPVRVALTVTAGGDSADVDELARTITDHRGTRQFAMQNVSETSWIYEDALTSGSCALTPFADSARQHRLYLTALRTHLGLPDTDDTPCPIS